MMAMNLIDSMQDWPLLVGKLIDHAASVYPDREIVTQTVEGPLHRSNWLEVSNRARRLAKALRRLGIQPLERVGTLAWNTHRHIECWYGIAGIGGIVHTINPRLFPEQISYIVNHAEDRVLVFDLTFLGIVEQIAPALTTVERFVVLTDRAHMPQSKLDLLCYEELLEAENEEFRWVDLDENAPVGLCYTSGTTGRPKGVLYTHRSNVLHCWAACIDDSLAISSRSTVLPIVPMFHANGWSIPYSAAMAGAKLVMGGPNTDSATLQRLIIDEEVTMTAAVPTVWLSMLQHLQRTGSGLGKLQRVVIGGSATPRSMIEIFERVYGITVAHAWGLTETSPIGTVGMLCGRAADDPPERRLDLKSKQGRAPFGVEMKTVDEAGAAQPRDGLTPGYIKVRGPWIASRYFKDPKPAVDAEGWFDTGDIGTLDRRGYLHITDRAKDVIKSGGEWISSIELENIAVGCAGIAEAAVIGLSHPKWDERPLLILVRSRDQLVGRDDVVAHLSTRIPRWWMPDDIVFVDEIPHTAVGKILKTSLREQFKDYRFSSAG